MEVIRALTATDDIDAFTHLLHRAYAALAAQGFKYNATHQSPQVTRERLHSGVPFVAIRDEKIVGTITLYRSDPISISPWYATPSVFKFGQFGIEPAFQKCGLGRRMYEHIETTARALGAAHLALDTAEGAAHLIRWYASLGYGFKEYVQWDSTNYRSVILSKSLT